MPALPSCVIEPIWDQFRALLPERVVTHPLGCHRPRIADRIVFDKLVLVLVSAVGYEKVADTTCSATTLRDRRDEWILAGLFGSCWMWSRWPGICCRRAGCSRSWPSIAGFVPG